MEDVEGPNYEGAALSQQFPETWPAVIVVCDQLCIKQNASCRYAEQGECKLGIPARDIIAIAAQEPHPGSILEHLKTEAIELKFMQPLFARGWRVLGRG